MFNKWDVFHYAGSFYTKKTKQIELSNNTIVLLLLIIII